MEATTPEERRHAAVVAAGRRARATIERGEDVDTHGVIDEARHGSRKHVVDVTPIGNFLERHRGAVDADDLSLLLKAEQRLMDGTNSPGVTMAVLDTILERHADGRKERGRVERDDGGEPKVCGVPCSAKECGCLLFDFTFGCIFLAAVASIAAYLFPR